MENFMPKRESGLSRIVGGTEESKMKTWEKYEKNFKNQQIYEGETEKTHAELEILNTILEKIPDFIKQYGGTPIENLSINHFHIIDETKVLDKTSLEKLSEAGGAYFTDKQLIVIFLQKTIQERGLLYFAQASTHEVIHFNSFFSLDQSKEEEKLRRVGLEINSDKRYLNKLSEAITEELVKRFEKHYFQNIATLKELLKTKDELGDPDIAYLTTETVKLQDDLYETTLTKMPYAYKEFRLKLDKITHKIYEKFPDKFNSEEDVFNTFAQAYFTGNLVEVAPLIEKTYGKGSFRMIAKETSIKPDPSEI